MNIGIIGSGKVGGALGRGLAKHGHRVVFGTRDQTGEKARGLVGDLENARLGTPQDAASNDVLVIALPWTVLPEVIGQLGDLTGKILIDATNRFTPATNSAAEDLAALAPGAHVVKAFNTIGAEHMDAPQFQPVPSMLIAGDDAHAKATVTQLASELGFEVIDAGALSSAASLEFLARAWVGLSRTVGRGVAFKLLRH